MIISKLCPLLRCTARLRVGEFKRLTYYGLIQRGQIAFKTTDSAISEAKQSSEISQDVRPLGEKVKEAAKTASYTGVIIVGLGITGIIFFYVFRELFSSKSPNSLYSAALNRCVEDPSVEDALGAPIKGFGEESSRRRRNRVSHAFYERDGANCIRMQFYLRGTRKEGTVHLDMKEVDGKFEYRFLFVEVNDYTRKIIVLEDNRADIDKKPFSANEIKSLPSIL